jgi:hypothetical protein
MTAKDGLPRTLSSCHHQHPASSNNNILLSLECPSFEPNQTSEELTNLQSATFPASFIPQEFYSNAIDTHSYAASSLQAALSGPSSSEILPVYSKQEQRPVPIISLENGAANELLYRVPRLRDNLPKHLEMMSPSNSSDTSASLGHKDTLYGYTVSVTIKEISGSSRTPNHPNRTLAETRKGVRRGPLEREKAAKVSRMRKKRACYHCRSWKVSVSIELDQTWTCQ